jgi:acetate kinase
MRILVSNIGSTSFKFRLYEMPSERLLARGGAERIGSAESEWVFQNGTDAPTKGVATFKDYDAAIQWAGRQLEAAGLPGLASMDAIGFKPVMAQGISGTQFLDEQVLAAMEALNCLFPAHNPPYIAAVRAFNRLYPSIPCIGTFETAFYDNLPERNRRFPIPLRWEREFGIHKTGFHGASHRYVTERAAELRNQKDLRIISCHLGGSSSIAAVKNGVAIASSWGMTAQSGLPQNNRAGDFDVFALFHLVRNCGLSLDEVETALSRESGLKGMSGLNSGDIRDIRAAATAGNKDARIALEVFIGSIRRYIGQLLVELQGADVLVFTAGIAENNPDLRAQICAGMEFAGLRLDDARNASVIAREGIISADDSRIEVHVIPTNEEIIIARNACALLGKSMTPA